MIPLASKQPVDSSKSSEKKTVLIVDDEPEIIEFLASELEADFNLLTATNGEACLSLALSGNPDLILLDITMPIMDGLEACRRLKGNPQTEPIPVVILSARTEIEYLLNAFEIGVEDFIEKPFRLEAVKARVAAKIRKHQPSRKNELRLGNLRLEPASYQAFVGDAPVKFSRSEFRLVQFLVENQDKANTRAEILKSVWSRDSVSERTVDIYLVAIRKKLEKFDHEIAMLYGTGYVIRPRS